MVGWKCPTNLREASGLDPEAVHKCRPEEIVVWLWVRVYGWDNPEKVIESTVSWNIVLC